MTAEPSANIHWLATDQFGTPRMIFDSTGSLSGMSRHDYLAFGEELYAGIGRRTPEFGYTGDRTRQKFTQKERDNETGLDLLLARYYSSTQGRSTSPDEPFADQFPQNPQSWNLYSYTRNNPVRVADKDGRITPWDILDIVSLTMSVRAFWRQPSWRNAEWIAADAIGVALP